MTTEQRRTAAEVAVAWVQERQALVAVAAMVALTVPLAMTVPLVAQGRLCLRQQ